MRAAAIAAAVLVAGCSWTFDSDSGWLPLRGAPPSLAGAPHASGDPDLSYYRASDGRVWLKRREQPAPDSSGDLLLRSLDAAAEARRFPPQSFISDEGVVLTDPGPSSDPSLVQLRLTLDRLGAGPTSTREIAIPAATSPVVTRGPGFFVVALFISGGDVTDSAPPLVVAFDAGSVDSIPSGPEGWVVSTQPAEPPAAVERSFEGSARFILLHGTRGELAAYDVTTHTVVRLGAPPELVPPGSAARGWRYQPPPTYLYDDLNERVWYCGASTATVSLVTGERREFPFACLDLRHQRGGELLVQAPDGTVYALAADGGAVTPLGSCPPYGMLEAGGRAFLCARTPADEQGQLSSAWLGDRHVIHAGQSARFSADGRRLYWLEDVALQAGDLWSLELATGAAHHLVRNVTQFDELADGRLVAIANAAIGGPFNRAILVDEAAGESRWLAADMQLVQSLGDVVIVERRTDAATDLYALPVPPRTADVRRGAPAAAREPAP
jgi:hypothetical protein